MNTLALPPFAPVGPQAHGFPRRIASNGAGVLVEATNATVLLHEDQLSRVAPTVHVWGWADGVGPGARRARALWWRVAGQEVLERDARSKGRRVVDAQEQDHADPVARALIAVRTTTTLDYSSVAVGEWLDGLASVAWDEGVAAPEPAAAAAPVERVPSRFLTYRVYRASHEAKFLWQGA